VDAGRAGLLAAALATLVSACAGGDAGGAALPVVRRRGDIVYGADDRTEYFALADASARALISGAMVALVSNQVLRSTGGDLARAPTWGDVDGLCPGEPFADEPAAAFCSGVLVDWDLVLTAGHCARLLAINDFEAVFDYYYDDSQRLAVRAGDSFPIAAIVAEALDTSGSAPRLDYAWLRLARPASPPRQPVSVHVAPPSLAKGAPVIAVGAGGGAPLKWDAGGHVQDPGAAWLDFFVVDADDSAGSSGGGAFDHELSLLGITARGGTDFVTTPDGCQTTFRAPDSSGAAEEFTCAFRAVAGLCAAAPQASSLCRAGCDEPCQALPAPVAGPDDGGCTLAGTGGGGAAGVTVTLAALALVLVRRRRLRSDRQ